MVGAPFATTLTQTAELTKNISSKGGREDYIRVQIEEKQGAVYATPILGESGLIFTMVEADGMIRVPQNREGVQAGERVEVILY